MELARVEGTVVATAKAGRLQGRKLLLVNLTGPDTKPTNNYLVAVDSVGAGDGEVILWDAATGEPEHKIPGSGAVAYDIAFAPDNKMVAVARGNERRRAPRRRRRDRRRSCRSYRSTDRLPAWTHSECSIPVPDRPDRACAFSEYTGRRLECRR